MMLLGLGWLLACGPYPIVQVDGAVRLGGSATGQILVGTAKGAVVAVDAFGEQQALAGEHGSPVRELSASPLGSWWAQLDDGRLLTGTHWSAPSVQLHPSLRGMVVGCDGLHLSTDAAPEPWIEGVSAVAFAGCGEYHLGTVDGSVAGQSVSTAAIRRVQPLGEGLVWVDAEGRTGCLGCTHRLPREGVVDAIATWQAPFLDGELVWLDRDGMLWVR